MEPERIVKIAGDGPLEVELERGIRRRDTVVSMTQ
jgi:hypothetical protein